jgi:hypothetical protein
MYVNNLGARGARGDRLRRRDADESGGDQLIARLLLTLYMSIIIIPIEDR